MTWNICFVKNIDTIAGTYCGQEIQPGATYEIQDLERARWYSDAVISAITSNKLQVGNDISWITGSIAQIRWLEGSSKIDTDGVPIITQKVVGTDGRAIVQNTPRPLGTYTYFSGAGDSQTDQIQVGGTSSITDLCGKHSVGDSSTQVVYADFNAIANQTFINEGYLQWMNAINDCLSLEIVPKVTTSSAGTDTNYSLYGGYLIIPAAGNGNLTVNSSDIRLVQCTPNEFGMFTAGYWNATFNTTTKVFENITAAPSGNGGYNMFSTEVRLGRFGNRVSILGSGTQRIATNDMTQMGHNVRVKIIATTRGTDHEWYWNFNMTLYRKKTC